MNTLQEPHLHANGREDDKYETPKRKKNRNISFLRVLVSFLRKNLPFFSKSLKRIGIKIISVEYIRKKKKDSASVYTAARE